MTSVDRLSASRSNKEAELIYERLAEILDNEQALTALLSRPRDAITQPQKKALNSLARYYQISGGVDDDEKEGEEERYIKEALATVLSIPRNAVTQFQREVLSSLVLNSLARHFGVATDEGVDEEETPKNSTLLPINDNVPSITPKSPPKSQQVSQSSYNLRNSKVLGVEDCSERVRREGSQNGLNNILYSLSNNIRGRTNSNTAARRLRKRRRISPSSLPSFTLTGSVNQEESQADVDEILCSPRNGRQGDTPDISDSTNSNIDEPSTDLIALKRPPRHLSTPPRNSRQGDTPDNSYHTDTHSSIDDEGISPDRAALVGGRHPWKTVLDMTRLSLDPILQEHLTKYGSDPEEFLSDHGRLTHKVGSFSYETRGDSFMACYRYTHHLEISDKVRWCFSMLNFYDAVKINWPGRKCLKNQVIPEEVEYFGPILGPGKLDPENTKKELKHWFSLGKKLNFLCGHFGPGCLFFLAHMLSDNFITNKFTWTGTFEDAHAHLTRLGLKLKASESGANELGQRIRDLLIKPFKEA